MGGMSLMTVTTRRWISLWTRSPDAALHELVAGGRSLEAANCKMCACSYKEPKNLTYLHMQGCTP